MEKSKLVISPKTRVGELLYAYPELEDALVQMAPAFAKLKNPILRKTVAQVATLQQAAVIGGLKVDELVNRLRKEAGQESAENEGENSEYLSVELPDWFLADRVVSRLDATPVINTGGSPMAEILALAGKLQPAEILELKTPFVPAPIIDMLKGRGFLVYAIKEGDGVISYITPS